MTNFELTKELINNLERKNNKDEPFVIINRKSFSINEAIQELIKQTPIGIKMESDILGLAIDLLIRGKEKIKDE